MIVTLSRILFCFFILLCQHAAISQINVAFKVVGDTSACGSLQAKFIDQTTSSAGSIIDYKWDLGVANSSLQNPGAIYTTPGTYTVCLTATDIDGNEGTLCKTDLIHVLENPTPNFTVDYTQGCAPITAVFTNTSYSPNGAITTLLWDIGGSANVIESTDPDAQITTTYSVPGDYAASLYVVDEKGCSETVSIPGSVEVNGIEPVDLEIIPLYICSLPWKVQFRNLNEVPGVSYVWEFSNGQTYEGSQPPTISFNEAGTYNLTVYLANGECRDTISYPTVIDTDPELAFTTAPTITCEGSLVTFTDNSYITADSTIWIFGDGNISTSTQGQHVYDDPGCYIVSLVRYTNVCVDTTILDCLEILPKAEITYTVENQYNCHLPTQVTGVATSDQPGEWAWSYEGNEFQDDSIQIIFETYGDRFLNLSFYSENGCTSTVDSIELLMRPFEVNLPLTGPEGCAPLTFTLQDSVDALFTVVDWQWSIDNGLITSSDENPTYTLPDTGQYDLELIATNEIGCKDTLYYENYIKVGILPEVEFSATPLVGCKNEVRTFTDLSSANTNGWYWVFGEDGFSTDQHPSYYFPSSGIFDVTLVASHNGCFASKTFKEYITVLEPDAKFAIQYNCDDPYTVTLENRTQDADEFNWTIDSGNGIITSMDSVVSNITYPTRGKYVVTLEVYNDSTMCLDTRTDTVRITEPIASYTLDTLRGCAPIDILLTNMSQDANVIAYSLDQGEIDTTDLLAPTLNFTEGGYFTPPLLTIRDIHDCVDTFRLPDPIQINKLTAEIIYDNITCIPGVSEYIDASTDLFGTIISQEWTLANGSDTQTGATATYEYTEEGYYDLAFRVKDDWGCKDSVILDQEIIASDLQPDFVFDSLGCTFAPINFRARGNLQNVGGYLWDFGDGNTSTKRNPSHIYSQEGTYSVCLTLIDARGCEKQTCKENIILIQDPIADFAADPVFSTCPPLLSTFENKSTNSVDYIWDFGDDTGVSFNEEPSHVYTSPGNFDISLIAIWTQQCTDTLTLDEYINVEGPIADFSVVSTASCIPQSAILQAASDLPYEYVWDYGNGILDSVGNLVLADTTIYYYDVAGTYTPKLIVSDDKGCTRSFSSEAIRVDDAELLVELEDTAYCGIPSNVKAKNLSTSTADNITYIWNIDGTTTTQVESKDLDIDISTPGTYDLYLIANYGGCSDTLHLPEAFEVGTIPVADFQLDQNALCRNIDVRTENNSTVSYGSIVSNTWILPDGSTKIDSSITFTVDNQYDNYTIDLIVETHLGCTDTLSKTYEVAPSADADLGPDQVICIGESITITPTIISDTDPIDTYWEPDTTLSCTACIETVAAPVDTTDYIFVSIHENGCIDRDTITVNVAPVYPPELSLSSDSIICLGSTATISIDDFNEDYVYAWLDNDDDILCTDGCRLSKVSPDSTSTYTLTATNLYGCVSEKDIIIEVETEYEDFLTDQRIICLGDEVALDHTAGSSPQWDSHPNLSCTSCSQPIANPVEDTYFKLTVTSPLGCYYTDSVLVSVLDESSIDAGDDILICKGETVAVVGQGVGDASWSPSTIFEFPEEKTSTISPTDEGYITLVMTADLCSLSDSLYISIAEKAEIQSTEDTLCYGDNTVLYADGLYDDITWYSDGEIIGSGTELFAAPTKTTVYRAMATFRSCDADTSYSEVLVHPEIEYTLETYDYTIFTNDDVDISPTYDISRNYDFQWIPDTGMDCPSCADPEIRGLTENIDYALTITDLESMCQDSVEIMVRYVARCNEEVFYMPNVMSLQSTGQNAFFGPITENEDEFISIVVYDRWGNKMHETEDINNRWNGMWNGSPVSQGVYLWIMNLVCPETGENYSLTGDVTVLR